MFNAMVRFYLNTFFVVADACEGVNHKWEACSSKNNTKHRSTHITNYQSSERKSNQHDESDQMEFMCTLKNALLIIRDRFGMSFASKGLGYLAELLLLLSLLARYKLSCYQTTPLLTISALADILTKNYLSFPSAPRWVRHSYLSKRATIGPIYLWVIKAIFWRRCRGVKRLW